MSETVIKVENLSKQYRLGERLGYKTLREAITNVTKVPFLHIRKAMGKVPGVKRSGTDFMSSAQSSRLSSRAEYIWALKDVSFEVKRGEVIGIIGRNGAGKSTLLKILSKITEPTEGRVELRGRVGSLLEVGTGFHPELTGHENIYLYGAILGMDRYEVTRKFDEIVAFAELEKFIDTPVKRYSSGMYMRLAFAVAAHLEPEILLVDEVLAVGDAAFQKKCLYKMEKIGKEGRTVLFVSHNMTAIQSLCHRAMWLENGQTFQTGNVNNVVSSYLQNGMHSVLTQVWDNPATAPGNERVRLHCARISPLDQNKSKIIYVETPLQFEFEFWNYLPDAALSFIMDLFTIEGTYVLAIESDSKPRHKGLVKGIIRIPPNFLNNGTYSVTLEIVKDTSSTVYHHPNVLVFEVHDSNRTGHWFGKWPGVVRPKFEWITEDIGEKEVNHENKK